MKNLSYQISAVLYFTLQTYTVLQFRIFRQKILNKIFSYLLFHYKNTDTTLDSDPHKRIKTNTNPKQFLSYTGI